MTDNEAILFVTLFTMLGGVATAFLLSRYLVRRLRSRELMRALEMGKDLPQDVPRRGGFQQDLRSGVLLIAFSIGLALFVWAIGGEEAVAMSFVPLFLGVGFVINALLTRRLDDGPPGRRVAEVSAPDPEGSE